MGVGESVSDKKPILLTEAVATAWALADPEAEAALNALARGDFPAYHRHSDRSRECVDFLRLWAPHRLSPSGLPLPIEE